MIYFLAVLLPPLGLLLNGQPFAAVFNLVMIVPCLILGILFFPLLLLVPSAHAVVAIAMRRDARRHEEIVDAIRQHGPPPGWRG